MFSEESLPLRKAKRTGVWVCLGSVLLGILFLSGLGRESYWALAIPVALAVLSLLGLAFWMGYTINTVRGIPAEADHYDGAGARRIAKGICITTVVLAVLFLLGISHQSYWALAIPVAAIVLTLLGMIFWIGWAIITQQPPPQEDSAAKAGAQPPAADAGTTGARAGES